MSKNEEKPNLIDYLHHFRFLIIGLLIVFLIFSSFFSGVLYSCSEEGTYRKGLKCVEPKIVTVCEDSEGNLYPFEESSGISYHNEN